jgi:hypothetical protein
MKGNRMTNEEKTYVQEVVEDEGFESAFIDYTDFAEIEDLKFHELRQNYILAQEALSDYIN